MVPVVPLGLARGAGPRPRRQAQRAGLRRPRVPPRQAGSPRTPSSPWARTPPSSRIRAWSRRADAGRRLPLRPGHGARGTASRADIHALVDEPRPPRRLRGGLHSIQQEPQPALWPCRHRRPGAPHRTGPSAGGVPRRARVLGAPAVLRVAAGGVAMAAGATTWATPRSLLALRRADVRGRHRLRRRSPAPLGRRDPRRSPSRGAGRARRPALRRGGRVPEDVAHLELGGASPRAMCSPPGCQHVTTLQHARRRQHPAPPTATQACPNNTSVSSSARRTAPRPPAP